MRTLSVLSLAGLLLTSLCGYSQEICQEGFFCDISSPSHAILRVQKLVRDETLLNCEVTTVKDFGLSLNACETEAINLNRKQPAPLPSQACRPEAQIIAVVTDLQQFGIGSCVAIFTASSIRQFNPSGTCPLDMQEALAGVQVGVKSGHDCAVDVGSLLTGVIYKDLAGQIRLE